MVGCDRALPETGFLTDLWQKYVRRAGRPPHKTRKILVGWVVLPALPKKTPQNQKNSCGVGSIARPAQKNPTKPEKFLWGGHPARPAHKNQVSQLFLRFLKYFQPAQSPKIVTPKVGLKSNGTAAAFPPTNCAPETLIV